MDPSNFINGSIIVVNERAREINVKWQALPSTGDHFAIEGEEFIVNYIEWRHDESRFINHGRVMTPYVYAIKV